MLNQGPSTKRQCRAVSIRPPSRSQPDRSRDRALIPMPLHQVLSAVTSTRVYISEQFPTALRGRGHIFGESTVRLFAGVLAPFLMEPHTASPTIFFGTIFLVVAIGAFIPLAFGRETVPALA
jgi:hypothetical protein